MASVTPVVYSDASLTDHGGYTAKIANSYCSSGRRSPSESRQSSPHRAIQAVRCFRNHILSTFVEESHCRTVYRFSKRCPSCTKRSCKQHLPQLAIQIFNLCFVSHVELQVQWLPRTANQKADYLSRIVDPDDWASGRKSFQILVLASVYIRSLCLLVKYFYLLRFYSSLVEVS